MWGLNWLELPPGEHTVEFGEVEGLSPRPPGTFTITITAGQTTTVASLYDPTGGIVRVQTSPPVPATIYVNGIAANDWGVWGRFPWSGPICFGPVAGYTQPPCQPIAPDVTGVYTPLP